MGEGMARTGKQSSSSDVIPSYILNVHSYSQIILAVSGIYWTMEVSKVITEKDGLKVCRIYLQSK
jgi:hypothetical protein